MFRTGIVAALIALCMLSAPVFGRGFDSEQDKLFELLNPADAERILLLGFTDLTIDRIQKTVSSAGYRRRGDYQSSTWSQRVTSYIESEYGLRKLAEWPMTEVGIHCAVYYVPEPQSVDRTIELLSHDDKIEIVQRMHRFKTEGHLYNDPYYRLQSNMHSMHIEQAHNRSTGKNVVVAVIDTGVDTEHPDLAGQIGSNRNFAAAISEDFSGDMHGTAIAGVIAARRDNRTGIIGVAPDAKIIALKACWPNRAGAFEAVCNSFTLALAVNTAIRMGADILNMSLTGPEDPLLEKLLAKARDEGIIVVAADPGRQNPDQRFPASMAGVIPVQSSASPDAADASDDSINAPGDHILTTLPYGTYDFVSGSSVAAAQVSGIVALMREIEPDLDADRIRALLKKSTRLENGADSASFSSLNAGQVIRSLCEHHDCPDRTD